MLHARHASASCRMGTQPHQVPDTSPALAQLLQRRRSHRHRHSHSHSHAPSCAACVPMPTQPRVPAQPAMSKPTTWSGHATCLSSAPDRAWMTVCQSRNLARQAPKPSAALRRRLSSCPPSQWPQTAQQATHARRPSPPATSARQRAWSSSASAPPAASHAPPEPRNGTRPACSVRSEPRSRSHGRRSKATWATAARRTRPVATRRLQQGGAPAGVGLATTRSLAPAPPWRAPRLPLPPTPRLCARARRRAPCHSTRTASSHAAVWAAPRLRCPVQRLANVRTATGTRAPALQRRLGSSLAACAPHQARGRCPCQRPTSAPRRTSRHTRSAMRPGSVPE